MLYRTWKMLADQAVENTDLRPGKNEITHTPIKIS